jgi:hypothetical protein
METVNKQLKALKLGNLSFTDIVEVLFHEVNMLSSLNDISQKEGTRVLVFLELFVLLSDKWVRSRAIDKGDKIVIREKQRLARAFFIDISKRMEREKTDIWINTPIPKTSNRGLAEEWLEKALANTLEEVYTEQTPQQREALERLLEESENRKNEYSTSNTWINTPIFGTKTKNETEDK